MKKKYMLILVGAYFAFFWLVQLSDLQKFIADDSYFYMVTARNLVFTGWQTFSGIMATNGVHPLWLYFLSASYQSISLINPGWLFSPLSTVPLSILVLACGVFFSWKTAEFLDINPLPYVVLPLGFLSAMNMFGSEAYLHYCCISLLTWLALKPVTKPSLRAALVGIAAAAVFLARLDSIFLVAAFLAWWYLRQCKIGLNVLSFVLAAAPSAIYVGSNIWFFGQAVPVSGWLKSSFPELSIDGLGWANLGTELSGYNLIFGWLPIITATLLSPWWLKRIDGKRNIAIPFWVGSLLHLAFTAGFSRGATGWLWYYITPVMLAGIILALMVQSNSYWIRAGTTALMVFIALFFCAYTLRTLLRPLPPDQGEVMLAYLDQAGVVDTTVIVGDAPGFVAFYSTNRVIGLDMLTANPNFVKTMINSRNGFQYILDYAKESGYPVQYLLLTTGTWLGGLDIKKDQREISYYFLAPARESYQFLGTLDLKDPVYRSDNLIVWQIPGNADR